VSHAWPEGLHRRRTNRGEVRVTSGASPAGEFVVQGQP
jgi:hypothetical protein